MGFLLKADGLFALQRLRVMSSLVSSERASNNRLPASGRTSGAPSSRRGLMMVQPMDGANSLHSAGWPPQNRDGAIRAFRHQVRTSLFFVV